MTKQGGDIISPKHPISESTKKNRSLITDFMKPPNNLYLSDPEVVLVSNRLKDGKTKLQRLEEMEVRKQKEKGGIGIRRI